MTGAGIPPDHIRECPDHGIVSDPEEPCPACETEIEARPEEVLTDVTETDLRWKIEPGVMIELAPLVEQYLEDNDKGPAWIAVAELDESLLPAGYTRQERWFNVLQYQPATMIKTIVQNSNAKETIENLRNAGYSIDQ